MSGALLRRRDRTVRSLRVEHYSAAVNTKRRARGRKRRRDPEKARACERRRYRRKTAERLAAGLCPSYGKTPPEPERRLCEAWAEKKRAGDRRRYAEAKASGTL